jgi:hypothetical protein
MEIFTQYTRCPGRLARPFRPSAQVFLNLSWDPKAMENSVALNHRVVQTML